MSHNPAHIVIADDDRAIAELLCTILEDEGYSIQCCYSGKAALDAIKQRQPNLVILDMQMEWRGSGLEVVQRMRAHPALYDTPVIIYSADSLFLSTIRDQLLAHRCLVLEKPFDIDTLLDMVARAVCIHAQEVGR
jgi:two-component system nitrogen regulation response regulator NtrX